MSVLEKKSFDSSVNTRINGKIKVETITLDGLNFSRSTAAPGWKWSVDVKPAAKTESCEVNHLIYVISGRIQIRMDDGTEMEINAGDVASIPPGHDGWLVGDETGVWIEMPR